MSVPFSIEPLVGDWYASHGELFEVVAIDDDESSVEVQFADGTLAEIDLDDWSTRCQAGALRRADPPEDLNASMDVDADDIPRATGGEFQDEAGLRASGIEELDLFE
jgi:hypothetical protein